jgi:hypothetical protein
MMTKKLSKHSNSLALVIDRPILEILGIDEQTPLQISSITTRCGGGLRFSGPQ